MNKKEYIASLRIMDDPMMRLFFDNDVGHVALRKILREIMNMPDLEIAEAHTQHVLNNPGGRELELDILAVDSEGRYLNVEMQRATETGKLGKRSQYHGALLMTTNTPAGSDFIDVPDVYVIFITEKDFGGRDMPLYDYAYRQKTGEDLPGTAHIVFVNGAYKDTSTELGKVINDIMESDPDRMLTEEIAVPFRKLKTSEGGRELEMAVDAYIREHEERAAAAAKVAAKAEGAAIGIIKSGRRHKDTDADIIRDLLSEIAMTEEDAAACLVRYDAGEPVFGDQTFALS